MNYKHTISWLMFNTLILNFIVFTQNYKFCVLRKQLNIMFVSSIHRRHYNYIKYQIIINNIIMA